MKDFGEASSMNNYQSVEENTESQSEFGDDEHRSIEKKSDWTTRKKLLLLAICLINVVSFGTVSAIMPYFPTVGIAKGLSTSTIGFIFSVVALTGVVCSPLNGLLLRALNFRLLVSGGMVLGAAAQILFGFGILLPPGVPFATWCFAFRILTALGSITAYTTTLTILPQEFASNYATVLGISEVFAGLGTAGAPAIGGVIYQAGGYFWPTISFGLLMLAVGVLLFLLFWGKDLKDSESETESLLPRTIQLFKIPGVFIGALCIFIGSMSFTVLEPIYALFGNEVLHLKPVQIGALYTPLWIFYLIFSGVTGKLVDKVGNHLLLMFVGFMLSALGYFVIGPAPSLESFLPVGTIWLTIVAEICIGIGLALVMLPPLPYMVKLVRERGIPVDLITSNLLSIIFTVSISLGVFVGPSLAGVVADYVTVRMDFAIIGIIIAGQGGILLIYMLLSCCTRYL